jgi:hypothetical protein
MESDSSAVTPINKSAKGNPYPLRLALPVDASRTERDCNCHWHHRYRGDQLSEKALPIAAALRSVRPNSAMSQFENRHRRYRNLVITSLGHNRLKQLPGVPASPFRGG